MLVRTERRFNGSGAPARSGRSWLLIKHRDDWAGPIDITTFAPHSVKTPEADLADILAADNPEIWRGNPPAKGGDTGQMFQRIIEHALEIQGENQAAQSKESPPKRAAAKTPKAAKSAKASRAKRRPA